MSLPNIPDIDPLISLERCDAINLLLSSIAMEEISLSHILNAEGEKIQRFLRQKSIAITDLLKVNDSVTQSLKTVVKSQILLVIKLEEVVDLIEKSGCQMHACKCHGKHSHCKHCQKRKHSNHRKEDDCDSSC